MTTAATTARPLCRHCGEGPATRARGLCYWCYRDPGIRDLYPSESRSASKGGDFYGGLGLAQPTSELPGDPGKIEAMAERVKARLAVFHPDDAGRSLA